MLAELPDDVVRELSDRSKTDRLAQVLERAIASAERELESRTRFMEWARRNASTAPPRERGLAQSAYIAACREVEAAKASYDRTLALRDSPEAA